MLETLRKVFPTVSRLRFTVQMAMFFLMVWGSNVVGHYAADKISTALPALSCAYDKQHGSYCVLIPLQHQMHHRIGAAVVKAQQVTMQVVLPILLTMATFLAFFFVVGKAFCGWICPLGTVQELLNKVGRRFNRPLHRLQDGNLKKVRPAKWVMLLGLIFALPILAGVGIAPHGLSNPYCDVCPSRIVTTLLTADVEEIALKTGDSTRMLLNALGNIVAGFVVVAALAIRQPFCRICPMLSFNSLFQRLSPMRLSKVKHESCEKCGVCTQACPMDIPEIAREHGRKAYHEDCTLCGRCAEYCPQDGVIKLKWGPFALFSSSREYYKGRVKGELPDGTVKPVKFVKRGEANA
ncbi:MAG: 4Fe-4S binding protein [Sterolibacteriaceae bacterium MAG5]|nr:4Fe-4S binding protein [Candidatus Nitricoxidireducens bremensis]